MHLTKTTNSNYKYLLYASLAAIILALAILFVYLVLQKDNNTKSNMEGNTLKEVFVIGAGPVGLWSAIQIKLRNPDIKIKIFEKYEHYKREHGLRINLNSLASDFDNQEIKAWKEELAKHAKWNKVFISTKEIEEKLKSIANNLDIKIFNQEIKSEDQINSLTCNSALVIAADGANSFVRNDIFKCDTKQKDFQYLVELKFETSSNTILGMRELYKTEKIINFIAEENISSKKTEATKNYKATLRFFVDKEVYEELGETTFKNSKNLKDDFKDLPAKLRSDILMWFAVRKHCNKELLFDASKCIISKIRLATYVSEELFYQKDDKNFVLVGDAAGGVPYFRSLNCGLICGTKLAKHVSNFLKDGDDKNLGSYANDAKSYIEYEISHANSKNFALNLIAKFVYVSSIVPWQTVLWRKTDIEAIKNIAKDLEHQICKSESSQFINTSLQVENVTSRKNSTSTSCANYAV